MELEIFEALTAVNIPAEKARAVAASIDAAIDRRYALHERQLFTKGDGAELRKDMAEMETRLMKAISEMQRWTIGSVFAAVALFAAIVKIWH